MMQLSLIPLSILLLCATLCFGAPTEDYGKPLKINAQVVTEEYDPEFNNAGESALPTISLLPKLITLQVQIGTPANGEQPQMFNLILDSVDVATFVFDAENCNKAWCNSITKFNISASSTYQFLEKPIPGVKNAGELGMDSFYENMRSHDLYQKFGVFNTERVPVIDWKLPADGLLSLAYDASNSVVPAFNPTPFQNYLRQMPNNERLVSLWVDASNVNGSAELTVGAQDSENCKNEWKFVDVSVISQKLKGLWSLPLGGFQIGDKGEKHNFTDVAFVNTLDSVITGPLTYVAEILKYLNGTTTKPFVSCVRDGLPVLKFYIGGNEYTVGPQQYIIDYNPAADQCILGLTSWPKSTDDSPPMVRGEEIDPEKTWSLGHAFLRSYCTTLDFGTQKRIGFTPANSASPLAISALALLFSLLAAFVHKITNNL